jgi:hypothetical protein
MAETKSSSTRSRGNGQRSGSDRKLSAREAIAHVRDDLPSLLGRNVESVIGVERDDDGNWEVLVQVVELSRIPSSTDVLGAYLVTLDGSGDLVGYTRRRRYQRGQADSD